MSDYLFSKEGIYSTKDTATDGTVTITDFERGYTSPRRVTIFRPDGTREVIDYRPPAQPTEPSGGPKT